MSQLKATTSFPDAGAGANGIAAMLPALLQNRGVDPAYLMGMLNNGNGGGSYGNRTGYREDEDDEDWDDDNDRMGERRGRSSRTGRFVRR